MSDWEEIVAFAEGLDPNDITYREGGLINEYAFLAEDLIDEVTWPGGGDLMTTLDQTVGVPWPWLAGSWSGGQTAWLLDTEIEFLDMTDKLDRIELPLGLFWGAWDFVVPPAVGRDIAQGVSSSEVIEVSFETAGHSPMDNQPGEFVDAVMGMVDSQR